MKLKPHNLLLITVASILAACGSGSGSQQPGLTAMIQTTHLTGSTASGDPDAETDPQTAASAIKPIYRDDNMYIDLQLGLVNLRATELVPCTSIATVSKTLLNFILPAAMAHAAHIPSGPSGVMDVLKPDLLVWDLGELSAKPGSYCGIKLEISNVAAPHHEEEEEGIDMTGKGVLVSPCYYPDTANSPQTPLDNQTSHSCIEAAYSGDALSSTVLFGTSISLDANHRSIHLMLATSYDNWFNTLNMDLLPHDAGEQTKLAQNVLDSFYLYSGE